MHGGFDENENSQYKVNSCGYYYETDDFFLNFSDNSSHSGNSSSSSSGVGDVSLDEMDEET